MEVGSIPFLLRGNSAVRGRSEAYRAFVEAGRQSGPGRPGEPAIPIEVVAGPIEPRWLTGWTREGMRLDTESTWALRLTGDPRWPYHLGPSPVRTSDPPQFHLLAGPRFGRARLYVGAEADRSHGPYGSDWIDDRHFHPLDEVLFHHVAAFHRAMVVHASGVELEEGGVLFLGDSGAGKSTIAELFEKQGAARKVYSDDRIVIRRDPRSGRWWMHGTPWHGTLRRSAPGGVELRALCFLEQARSFELERLGPEGALPRLLQVALGPWWLPEAPELQLGLLDELLGSEDPGFYRLGFTVDPCTVSELRSRLFPR